MVRITNAGDIDETGGIVSDGSRIFFLERFGGHWHPDADFRGGRRRHRGGSRGALCEYTAFSYLSGPFTISNRRVQPAG